MDDQDTKYGAMQTPGLNPMSREEYEAIRARGVQQAEWARPKPPTVKELQDEVERLQLIVAELRKKVRSMKVWTLSIEAILIASLLLALFGME